MSESGPAKVPLPGFFGSFNVKSEPDELAPAADASLTLRTEHEREQPAGGGDRKGSLVTVQLTSMGSSAAGKPIGPVILMRGTLQKRTTGKVSARHR